MKKTPEERSYERRLDYLFKDYDMTRQSIRASGTYMLVRKGWCITLIVGYLGLTADPESSWKETPFVPLYAIILGFYFLEALSVYGRETLWKFIKQVDRVLREPDQKTFEEEMAKCKSWVTVRKSREGKGREGLYEKLFGCLKAAAREQTSWWYIGLWIALFLLKTPTFWSGGILVLLVGNKLVWLHRFWWLKKEKEPDREQSESADRPDC